MEPLRLGPPGHGDGRGAGDDPFALVAGAVKRAGRGCTRVAVTAALQRMLGLRVDLADFYRRGPRPPPRSVGPPFPRDEAAAVSHRVRMRGQRHRLPAGHADPGRRAARPTRRGVRARWSTWTPRCMPFPAEDGRAEARRVASLGFSRQKALARRIIAAAAEGHWNPGEAVGRRRRGRPDRLLRLRGVGRWSGDTPCCGGWEAARLPRRRRRGTQQPPSMARIGRPLGLRRGS